MFFIYMFFTYILKWPLWGTRLESPAEGLDAKCVCVCVFRMQRACMHSPLTCCL